MPAQPTTTSTVAQPRRAKLAQARARGTAATHAQVRDALPDVIAELAELRARVTALEARAGA